MPHRHTVIWLVPLLFTAHNAEEALTFPRYMPRLPALLPTRFAAFASRLDYQTMLAALAVVSLLAVVLAFAANRAPESRWRMWLLLALQATVAVNVVSHVMAAVFLYRGYAPGVITAVAINAPFSVHLFRRAARERWVSSAALRALVPAALVLHGPVLLGALWLASAGRT